MNDGVYMFYYYGNTRHCLAVREHATYCEIYNGLTNGCCSKFGKRVCK